MNAGSRLVVLPTATGLCILFQSTDTHSWQLPGTSVLRGVTRMKVGEEQGWAESDSAVHEQQVDTLVPKQREERSEQGSQVPALSPLPSAPAGQAVSFGWDQCCCGSCFSRV